MSEELMKLISQHVEGTKPLLKYMHDHKNDPFFETKDGKDIMAHINQMAEGSMLLMLKATIVALQDVVLDMKIAGNGEG